MNKSKLEIFSYFCSRACSISVLKCVFWKRQRKKRSSREIKDGCKVFLKILLSIHTLLLLYFNPSADSDSLHCLGQIKYLLYHWGVVELSFVRHFEAGKC